MQQKHYRFFTVFFLLALIAMTGVVWEQHTSVVYAGTLSGF